MQFYPVVIFLKKIINFIFLVIMILFVGSSLSQVTAQNLTGNPWLSWVPELNSGVETPSAAFGINAVTNRLQNKVDNTCQSYGIGNDKRGYIYYANLTNDLIMCVNPFSKTVISTFGFNSGGASIAAPHAFQSFYDLAANKHYLAVSNVGQDINTQGAVTILDVTDPALITFVKNILIPSSVGTGTRCPGMDIYQSAFTSAGTTIYVAVDDGHIPSDPVAGLFLKITDPLNAVPNIAGYAPRYNDDDYNSYTHSIQVDNGNQRVYVSGDHKVVDGLNQATVLSFNTTDGTPTNNVYIGIDADGTGSGGFHTIAFDRAGGVFYVGSQYDPGGDRAYKFNVQPNAASSSTINYTSQSPVLGSGSTTATVKGVNLLPDASKLYAVLETDGPYFTPNNARIMELNQTTLAVNAVVQNIGGTGAAQFGLLDPHSYAFTIHDFGDAPASYGAAAHFLSNEDYLQDRLRIGATIDGDLSEINTADFNGDDLAATPKTNDEDGITPAMKSAAIGLYYGMTGTYTITGIAVKNTTFPAVTANLIGWIDFNHDGIFQSTEGVSVSVPNGTTSANLSWTIPANVSTGPVFLRLRLSSDPSLTVNTASSVVFDGEAEDYKFSVPIAVSGSLFGDQDGNTIFGSTGAPGSGENGTTAGVALYAYLIINGIIADSAHISTTGVYNFLNAPQNAGNTTIVIGTNSLAPGTASADIINLATNPPTDWVFTGSSVATSSNGNSGVLSVNLAITTITAQNFGIEKRPQTNPVIQNVSPPLLGIIPAGTATTPISGFDDEDGTLGSGNKIRITNLPSNAIMMYGVIPVAVIAGQQITGFNPMLVSFIAITPFSTSVTFKYAFIDAASQQDLTPASYSITWLTTLPVTLESFTGTAKDCNSVKLDWRVGDAVNFSRFEIERSSNGIDFKTIGSVNYIASIAIYTFNEAVIDKGAYQYRLKMIDTDGKSKYSPVVLIRLDCKQQQIILVYPNPAKDKIVINGLKGGEQISMYNAQGQVVYSQKNTLYQLNIDITTIATGLYTIIVTDKKGKKMGESAIVKTD